MVRLSANYTICIYIGKLREHNKVRSITETHARMLIADNFARAKIYGFVLFFFPLSLPPSFSLVVVALFLF